jgi:hypothetical protein
MSPTWKLKVNASEKCKSLVAFPGFLRVKIFKISPESIPPNLPNSFVSRTIVLKMKNHNFKHCFQVR